MPVPDPRTAVISQELASQFSSISPKRRTAFGQQPAASDTAMVRDKEFYKTIFRIALPAAFQSLVSFLVVVADDVMVSSLENGVAAQAAVSQINCITAFFTATLLGLVSGSSVLIAQYWGKRDLERIRRIFAIVMRLCIAVSFLFVAAAKLFPRQISGIVIGADETEVMALALTYFAIVCFSYIPYAVTNALIGMLRAVEIVKVTLLITTVSLLVNISGNYLLIFGKCGFPQLGVAGAAAATIAARIAELIIILVYTFRIQKHFPICIRDFFKTDRLLRRDYIRYGLPVGLADMQWALIGLLKATIVGQLGAVFMAANNIANSMVNLGTLFTFALASGACVVVGKAVGAGDIRRAREYSGTIQIMFFLIGLCMAAVVFLVRDPFISLYGSAAAPEVASLSRTLIAIVAVTLIGSCYHASCFLGINRGAGDSRFVALVDMICGWFVVLPATALAAFVFHAPLPAVFLCTRIDQCFKWLIALIRLRGNRWIRNVTRS